MANEQDWWSGSPVVAPVGGGPVYGAPPKPKDPPEPKTTYRSLTPEEIKAKGLQPGTYQVSSEGKVDRIGEAATDPKVTEYQAKSAGFLGRMVQADREYGQVPEGSRDARTAPGQWFHDTLPSIENSFNTSDRQKSDQAARNFIAASLRQESGAAISSGEFDNQYRIFFPMPGDGPDVIKQKAEARRQAIEGFRVSAGPMADKVAVEEKKTDPGSANSASLASGNSGGGPGGAAPPDNPFGGLPGKGPKGGVEWDAEKSRAYFGDLYFDANGQPLGPEGGTAYDAQGREIGLVGGVTDTQDAEKRTAELDTKLEQMGFDPTSGAAYGDRATQGALFGNADEIYGVQGALGNLFSDKGMATGYRDSRDLYRRALEREAGAQGTAGDALELGGGLAMGALLPGGQGVGGALRTGAATGGVAGFGYGNGAKESLTGGVTGAVLGAGLGAAGGKVAEMYGARKAAQQAARNAEIDGGVIAAGKAENVPLREPDFNPAARSRRADLEQGQNSGPMIRAANDADTAAIEGRVSDLGKTGAEQDRFALGSSVQDAVTRHGKVTGEQAGAAYTRAGKIAGDVKVEPKNAIAEIDKQIATLKEAGENSNAAEIGYLNDVRADLSREGGLTVNALRDQRTNMRGQIKQRNLDKTQAEWRLSQVLDAAADDMKAGLASNPKALSAFNKADDMWRERMEFRRQITQRLVGPADNPISPEATARAVESMVKGGGDFGRFERLLKVMEPSEQADLAASVAANLGRNGKGDFSLPFLLRHLDPKSGINPRAAKLIFGEDGMESLSNLRKLAQAKVAAASERNTSNTGASVKKAATGLRGAILTALGFQAGGLGGAVVAPLANGWLTKIGEERAARLLLNPDLSKWAANAPATLTDGAAKTYIAKLSNIAAENAAIAADAKGLQQLLLERFADAPQKAAASEGTNEDRRVPIQ